MVIALRLPEVVEEVVEIVGCYPRPGIGHVYCDVISAAAARNVTLPCSGVNLIALPTYQAEMATAGTKKRKLGAGPSRRRMRVAARATTVTSSASPYGARNDRKFPECWGDRSTQPSHCVICSDLIRGAARISTVTTRVQSL